MTLAMFTSIDKDTSPPDLRGAPEKEYVSNRDAVPVYTPDVKPLRQKRTTTDPWTVRGGTKCVPLKVERKL